MYTRKYKQGSKRKKHSGSSYTRKDGTQREQAEDANANGILLESVLGNKRAEKAKEFQTIFKRDSQHLQDLAFSLLHFHFTGPTVY